MRIYLINVMICCLLRHIVGTVKQNSAVSTRIIPDFLYSWSIIVGYFDMLVGVFATKENLETALALPYVIGWLSTLNNSRAT